MVDHLKTAIVVIVSWSYRIHTSVAFSNTSGDICRIKPVGNRCQSLFSIRLQANLSHTRNDLGLAEVFFDEPLLCQEVQSDRRKFFSRTAAAVIGAQALAVEHLSEAKAYESQDDEKKLSVKSAGDARYFIAGGGCASFSHGIATPFDVVKTKMQAEPEIFTDGVQSATLSIVQEEGFDILFSGLGPTVIGYGIEGALKFGIYETLKPVFVSLFMTDDRAIPFLAASVVAGAIASLLLCPMESTRIKIVTNPEFASGLVDGLSNLIREQGALSLFSGFPAMLSKQIPYTMTKQVSFDMFSSSLYAAFSGLILPPEELKIGVTLTSAFLAAVLSCVASNPGDVVLTQTYKEKSGDGLAQIASRIYQERGLAGFFSGIEARLIHVGAIITSQLVVYDFIKQLLGLPSTGT